MKAFRVLAYVLAAEVVIQAMAIAWAMAGLFVWVDQEGGVLDKAVIENDDETPFTEVAGFMIHGMNGMMLIPLIALVLLIVAFAARVPGGPRKAGILLGLVVLQVVLGLLGRETAAIAPLHALNGFAIFSMALAAARSTTPAPAPAPMATPVV